MALHGLEVLTKLETVLQFDWGEKCSGAIWQNVQLGKAVAHERSEAGHLVMPRVEDTHCADAKKPRICSYCNRWLTRKVFEKT